jgi:hypothetical protein
LARFLHLGIRFESGSRAPDREAVDGILNKAKDWYRYAPNCWLIYTSRDATYWAEKLSSGVTGLKDRASFFICELNLEDRDGWVDKKFWDWIDKQR